MTYVNVLEIDICFLGEVSKIICCVTFLNIVVRVVSSDLQHVLTL